MRAMGAIFPLRDYTVAGSGRGSFGVTLPGPSPSTEIAAMADTESPSQQAGGNPSSQASAAAEAAPAAPEKAEAKAEAKGQPDAKNEDKAKAKENAKAFNP